MPAATDADYDNSAAVEGAETYLARWQDAARAFREDLGDRAQLAIPYGATAREKADLFLPEEEPRGLVIFVHGGYWRSRHRHDWSHLARGAVSRGHAVAIPSYTLAPEARVSRITLQISQAMACLSQEVPDVPIHLAGHSAGGHLVLRMRMADAMLPDEAADRLARIVAISPVADLRPLLDLALNDDLRLTQEEATSESPALATPARAVPTTIWVGGAELPAFLDQARTISTAWNAPLVVDDGRHHFDVIEPLSTPDSPLTEALLG